MPSNRRELILQRISDITVAVKAGDLGIVTAVRNRGLLSSEKRPATVLLDGDENRFQNIPERSFRADTRGGLSPSIMRASPQLFILLPESRPTNDASPLNGVPANVGTNLNILRNAVVQAIGADAELKSLLGANGGIVYNGCQTDLKSGSPLSGEMQVLMDFIYPYDPTAEGS